MNRPLRRLCGHTILRLTTLALGLGFAANVSANAKSARPDCFDADYIKFTLIKVSEWQLQHPPPRHQALGAPNGVFHTGLLATYQVTGNQGLLNTVLAMSETNEWKPGPKLVAELAAQWNAWHERTAGDVAVSASPIEKPGTPSK